MSTYPSQPYTEVNDLKNPLNNDNLKGSLNKKMEIEICNMKDFQKLTLDDTKELKSVTFRNMEVNGEFVDKFWELFSSGMKVLSFEDCWTVDNYSFSDLFDGDYSVRRLVIKSNDLTIDDVDSIFSLVYPYLIRQFVFSSNQLNADIVKNSLMKKLGSCSPELEILDTNSK
ncbi:hypothetical protein LY90DRAFT_701896 [Neocallimastix californiae]|jgi:hypothetical protein|uniref:RNI-like protein n=1 Tax=Neocallimastix californiae TaxID=1754190 RepID=A0A1Y2D9R5_9FUNG|nr:hypothetical protein LY90DRAFT_701896 [Neocallimastix californiae]|eukprot:ORY55998.1 hypothetical protein LY90DRAFT_701896 [Neocallimastix californiae]